MERNSKIIISGYRRLFISVYEIEMERLEAVNGKIF
jgi:hypothetical protein